MRGSGGTSTWNVDTSESDPVRSMGLKAWAMYPSEGRLESSEGRLESSARNMVMEEMVESAEGTGGAM